MALRQKLNDYVSRIPVIGDVLTTEVDGKLLGAAALGLSLTLAPANVGAEEPIREPAPQSESAAHGRVETMTGHESTTIDLKLGVPLGGDFSMFTRHRPTIDHEGNTGYFGLFQAEYEVVDGLKVVADTWLSSATEATYHSGLFYLGRFDFDEAGKLTVIGVAKGTFAEDGQFYAKAAIGYDLPITRDLDLSMESENNVFAPYDGNSLITTHMLRLGLGYDRFEAGAAADLKNVVLFKGKDAFDFNLGGYAEVKF